MAQLAVHSPLDEPNADRNLWLYPVRAQSRQMGVSRTVTGTLRTGGVAESASGIQPSMVAVPMALNMMTALAAISMSG